MQRDPSRQNGAILVMTILFLILLLGFAALALDLGRLYVLRTEMQNAADSAALAAAVELDGRDNAIADAVIAAKQLLSHKGRFATETELLSILRYDPSAAPEDNAFEFYSWINAERDPEKPASCTNPLLYNSATDTWEPDEDKCLALPDGSTTADAVAQYVKVKLHPELVIDEEEYFQISLFFLPVLGLFTGDGTSVTASTRVSAVAGAGGPLFCKYPPVFMCAYDEGANYPGIGIGEEVIFKDKNASTPWGPGNVGFLQVDERIEIPLDDGGTETVQNVGALAAAMGNEFIRKTCDEAIVSTQTGVITQKMRHALNTRFGLYEDYENAMEAFPPAPNTVDYPMDDIFNEESPDYDEDAFKGDGWNDTECLVGGTLLADCDGYTRPETFNRSDYISHYHAGSTPPVSLDPSRYALYEWELESVLNTPHLDPATPGPIDDRNSSSQEDCSVRSITRPGSAHCLNHNGEAIEGDPSLGDPRRRVLRIAVIKCSLYNISGSTPDIDLNPQGEFPFHEFFLTQHAQAASDTEFFAEYIGPVSEEKDIQEIKHNIIQLYE